MSAALRSTKQEPVALLYSFSQNAYHIEDVSTVCKKGQSTLVMNEPSDWMLVQIANSHEEASLLCEQLPRPTPFPKELIKALAGEALQRQERFHAGELTPEQQRVMHHGLSSKRGR